jgi:squalene-hopene/tetraprenyl-beta-curcumene cyclase
MRRSWWIAGIAIATALQAVLAPAADTPTAPASKTAPAPRKPDPQHVSADEPLLKKWSPDKAAEYLDKWASYHEGKTCLDCHETYAYLLARPYLSTPGKRHAERRAAAEAYAAGLLKEQWSPEVTDPKPVQRPVERRITEALMTGVVLAQHDAATTGKLQKVSRDLLDGMWKIQRPDGAWHWLKTGEPPSVTDDQYGAVMVAMGTGLAPDGYDQTPAAQAGLEKVRTYLKEHPPRHLHQRLLLMMAHKAIGGLMSPEEKQKTVADLFELQRPEGGWAMASLADWKRIDKTPQNLTDSDGYGTGFAVYALRLAGDVRAADPRIRKAIAWIETHQRESGYWYTRSPKINDALSTYVGTSYVIMAMHLCGEIPGDRGSR